MSALPVIVMMVALFAVPVGALVGVAVWTRWLRRRTSATLYTVRAAYAVLTVAGVLIAAALVSSVRAALASSSATPRDKARMLAEGISEAMNCGALGLIIAVVGAIWLGSCTWRWHRPARRRLVVGAMSALVVLAAVVVACLRIARRAHRAEAFSEATNMMQNIRVAQEGFRSETQQYANISSALAANQSMNHFALYPQVPREPGSYSVAWGAPCPAQTCSSGMEWSMLPLHVDGPVRFGYSTIAGRAGERPLAVVTIDGKPVAWPVPKDDWYIITAVGDIEGNGVFTTMLASSFSNEVQIDRGSR